MDKAMIRDIQVGDTIETFNEHYGKYISVVILYIPKAHQEPWIVQEPESKRKWRLWTEGPVTVQFSKTQF